MSLRLACRLSSRWCLTGCRFPLRLIRATNGNSSETRLLSSVGAAYGDSVADQMIDYAFSHARSQRSDGSYSDALRVLEQGVSNLQTADKACGNSIGKILLAMSTLHSERGELTSAVEKLQLVNQLACSSLALRGQWLLEHGLVNSGALVIPRCSFLGIIDLFEFLAVAAMEAESGLRLQMGQDAASERVAETLNQLVKDGSDASDLEFETLQLRAQALNGLVDLLLGNLDSAKAHFAGTESCIVQKKEICGRVALSYAEYLHVMGDLSLAKENYEKAVNLSQSKDATGPSAFGAAGMVSEEILLSTNCALGQVASHAGEFKDAEEILTETLKKAEEHFGSNHPKVGIVLMCMADMFRRKGITDGSSTLLIQEGLYRRAINSMKARAIDAEDLPLFRRDLLALARGGYSESLCIQLNRKSEGERMRTWAESAWTNRRLSLTQALDSSVDSNVCIVNTRIERLALSTMNGRIPHHQLAHNLVREVTTLSQRLHGSK